MNFRKQSLLFLKQIVYESKSYRRNPAAAFFTLVFPLLFLFMLRIFGNDSVEIDGGTVSRATFALAIIIALIAFTIFDVGLPTNSIVAFLLTMILGAATFTTLGIAFTSLIPNSDAAAPMVNASIIPLMFISDVFIPMDNAPNWLNWIAQIFPVRPFSLSLQEAYSPFSSGITENPENYVILLAWLIVGLATSLKFFSWEPRK